MRINIVYEVNNREFMNCLLLQREFILRGYDARIYNKTETILLHDNSKGVTLIPNSYRKTDLDHYRYAFNTNGGIIVVYPCEQVTNHKMPLFFDSTANNPVKKLPHLCWGKDYYDYIKGLGFTNKKNAIVGAIQLDFCRKEFRSFGYSRQKIAKKYSLPLEKKWILFISDFVYNSEVFTEQIISSGDQPEEIIRARQEFGRKSCEVILEWFERFLTEHDDYIVIYRKHPVELLTSEVKRFAENYKDCFYTISDLNVREWIFNCEKVVSWYSTTVVECMAAQKNMILVRPYRLDSNSGFNEYEFYKDYYKNDNYERLCNSLENNDILPSAKAREIVNKLYSIDECPTYKRVVDSIETIIKDKDGCSCDRESQFQLKRWKYLLSKMIPVKILIKKGLQGIYNLLKWNFSVEGETKKAINEWIASAKNRRIMKENSLRIDEIIKSIK